MDYFTPEELDAMDVGTRVQDSEGDWVTKRGEGQWSIEPEGFMFDQNIMIQTGMIKPTHDDLSPSQPTYPTPTLGELVALRESYRKDAQRDGKKLGDNTDNVFEQAYRENLTESVDRLNAVDRLIDERIGL